MQAGALVAGKLGGARKVALPFDAKVVAAGAEATKGKAVGGVADLKRMGITTSAEKGVCGGKNVCSWWVAS